MAATDDNPASSTAPPPASPTSCGSTAGCGATTSASSGGAPPSRSPRWPAPPSRRSPSRSSSSPTSPPREGAHCDQRSRRHRHHPRHRTAAEELTAMPSFVAPIRRRNHGRGHSYIDATGAKLPGVTSLLSNGLPARGLIEWAGRATAEYAVDHWDELAEMKPTQRLATLLKARHLDSTAAATRGTRVHHLASKLAAGDEVAVPEDIAGHVESYVQFLDDWQVEPLLVEAVVVSYRYGWAGTLDLLADLPPLGRRLLLDVKTARSGVWAETGLQLAGYRYSDFYQDADGAERPMLAVDGCAVVWVRADGYDLVPVEAGERELRLLRYAQQIAQWSASAEDAVGAALQITDFPTPAPDDADDEPSTQEVAAA